MSIPPATHTPRKAAYWHVVEGSILCDLCPRRCHIKEGNLGFCGTRRNVAGGLEALNYGKVAVSALDPIEKKPIFHFHPGAQVYSVGTFGCNLDCGNCQNSTLARSGGEVPYGYFTPEEAAITALEKGADGVAFTYNEPTVWAEYIMDVAPELRKRGLSTVLNTNGYIEPWAAEDLYDLVDAANIDVKGFTEHFYHSNCGGRLEEVLETCTIARDAETHVELTYLLIPGRNDTLREIKAFCRWVEEEMGDDTPVHFFRFRPSYRLSDLPEQTMERMEEALRVAQGEGLRFVYLAGVVGTPRQNTYCPECGELLVERGSVEPSEATLFMQEKVSRFCPSYAEVRMHFDGKRCPKCSETIPFVLKP